MTSSGPREMRKQRRLTTPDGPVVREVVFHDWRALGRVGGQEVEIVLNDEGRLIFGKCGCPFFRDHILNQGPCEHMIALLEASAENRDKGATINELGANDGIG